MLLTTMHDDVQVITDEQCKPDSDVLYNNTKGGLDVIDLVSTHNTTMLMHKSWQINTLAFVLDTIRTNAKTILQESVSQKMINFDFIYTLGKMLVVPYTQRIYVKPSGLQSQLVNKSLR